MDDNGFLQQSPETSGYDLAEGVFKVAMYAWDTNSLSWVRSISPGSSAGVVSIAPKTKKFDQASPTTLYLGEAAPGTLTSQPLWRVKRITFSAGGDVTAVEYAGIGSESQVWDNRASLSYS